MLKQLTAASLSCLSDSAITGGPRRLHLCRLSNGVYRKGRKTFGGVPANTFKEPRVHMDQDSLDALRKSLQPQQLQKLYPDLIPA